MNNKAILSVSLFSAISALISINTYASTNLELRDPNQTAIPQLKINQQAIQQDQLRKQNLSEAENKAKRNNVIRYTGRQLIENPIILEKLFVDALISVNTPLLPTLIELYKLVPNHDSSLIEWADAILQRENDLNQSVKSYRNLIANFPENNFIRFQLAETLFYNQEYEASKAQFEKLRASDNLTPQDINVFNNYIDVINRKDDWSFSLNTSFLRDKNLANTAQPGTKMRAPNGGVFTYDTPRQSGHGVYFSLGADKQWNLNRGKYLAFNSSLSSHYYWDKKNYNDLTAYLSFGIGYANTRFDVSIMPYLSKRWYAGGLDAGESLKRYHNTYGTTLSASYWLTKNAKYSLSYTYGYDRYDKQIQKKQYNGNSHSLSNAITYLVGTKQYWLVAIDLSTKSASNKTNAYNRLGLRLSWGQEWPLGLSTIASIGYGKRKYKEKDFLGKAQRNNEYSTSLSLWHKKLHYAGFTPRITWNYNKTSSNLPIYSYDKHQIFLEVGKTF